MSNGADDASQTGLAVPLSMKDRLRKSAPLIAVLGMSKILALLSSAVIARYFDRETSGLVFFVTGIVTLSVSTTTLGLAASSSYYYSRNLRRGRHRRNWQVFHLALLIALLPSAIIAFLALSMEEAREELAMLIVPILAVSCFMAAIRQISKMFFTIENRRDWSLIHDSVTYNLLIVITIVGWSILQGGDRLSAIAGLIAILIASSLAGAFAIWHTMRMLTANRGPFEESRLPSRRYAMALMAISLPSMIAQGSALILNKIDVLLIGPLAGAVEVGTYSVAIRMTFLSGVLTEIIALFLAPKIIAIGASGDRKKQWEILKIATKLQFAALMITTIPIILFHKQIITLIFGKEYIDVSTTYLILQSGKTLTAIFAPVIALFTALGYNKEMAKVAVFVAVANVGLCLWLIPHFGATGAAMAGTVALIVMFGNYIRISFDIRHRARLAK